MRVAIVTDFMDIASLGGSTRVVLEHATGLARRGHEVRVVSGSRNRSGTENLDGVTFHWFRYEPAPGGTRQNAAELRSVSGLLMQLSPLTMPRRLFRRVVREFAPDAVICHQPLSALSSLCGAGAGVPVKLYNFHSPWPEEFLIESWHAAEKELPGDVLTRGGPPLQGGKPAPLRLAPAYSRTSPGYNARRSLERMALERCNGVIVLSEYMRRLLEEVHGGRRRHSHLVHGGVDTKKFAPVDDMGYARRKFSIPAASFVVSTVRRLIPRMGLSILIEAVRLLRREGKDVLLLVGGRGPLGGRLEAQTAEAGLAERVRLVGHVDEAEMRYLYGASDLVVVPTVALEGFGLVVVEALACGAVTLGTPVGGIPEILGPLDGRLVLTGADAPAIASGVRYWLEHVREIEKLRPKCREYVCEKFTWRRAVAALEGVLESAAERSRRV